MEIQSKDLNTLLIQIIKPVIYEAVQDVLEHLMSAPIQNQEIPDAFLDIDQAAKFLNISKQTLYQYGDKIPRTKKFGKIYYRKTELTSYINSKLKGQV